MLLIQKEDQPNATLDAYRSSLHSFYSARVHDVDFVKESQEILANVNAWVREHTKDLIPKILQEPPSPDMRAILLNAIHFKGKWEKPFDKENTQPLVFFNRGSSSQADQKQTDFMTAYKKKFNYLKKQICGGKSVQLLELPYEGEEVSMVVVLPDERDGLKDIISCESLVPDVLYSVKELGIQQKRKVHEVLLPKFELETEYDLNDQLISLGMKDIFDEEKADLSGITGRRDLYVSLVKHKAVVKVDEEGTEAAAVTAVMMNYCLSVEIELERIEFRADHPFLFFIVDRVSRVILFAGTLVSL